MKSHVLQLHSVAAWLERRAITAIAVGSLIATAGCGADAETAYAGDEPHEQVDSIVQEISSSGDPVLIVMLRKVPGRVLAKDKTGYSNFIFSSTYPSVKEYYSAMSRGHYTIKRTSVLEFDDIVTAEFEDKAGVIPGGGDDEDGETVAATKRVVKRARQHLIDNSFNFAPFDTDGNGRISTPELKILVISDYTSTGAASRDVGCKEDSDGIDICSKMNHVGHKSGVQNYAHELAHSLGAVDLYGYDACHSNHLTLMSCTITSTSRTFYLDPWHRQQFGWFGAFGESISSGSGSTTLGPVSSNLVSLSSANRHYALRRSPSSPQGEKLILEWRVRDSAYEQSIPVEGVVVWYQKTTSSGALDTVPSLVNPAKTDRAHFVLRPINCVGDASNAASRGEAGAMTIGSTYRFKWPDGVDTGWLFEVTGLASNNRVNVKWTRTTSPAVCPG